MTSSVTQERVYLKTFLPEFLNVKPEKNYLKLFSLYATLV
jgi:hypothetical protein